MVILTSYINLLTIPIKSRMNKLSRIWYALVFILVISLLLYDKAHSMDLTNPNRQSLKQYLENPQLYGGYNAERFGKIVNISKGYFYFNIGDKSLKIYGSDIKKPVLGETVLFLNYRKDGRIELIDHHNYNYNYVLYAISVFSLMVFILILFKEWKITPRGFRNA